MSYHGRFFDYIKSRKLRVFHEYVGCKSTYVISKNIDQAKNKRTIYRWFALRYLYEYVNGENAQPESFVELGIDTGWNAMHLAAQWNRTRFYLVDKWMPKNRRCDYVLHFFKPNTNVTIVCGKSSTSTQTLSSNAPFDMVFIDACHKTEGVLGDIKAWYPLIKPGGIVSGHDYGHKNDQVIRAVVAYFGNQFIDTGLDTIWAHIKV
jgi:predicted O-methyltransferase YrrM